jgi:hypothetical protein
MMVFQRKRVSVNRNITYSLVYAMAVKSYESMNSPFSVRWCQTENQGQALDIGLDLVEVLG